MNDVDLLVRRGWLRFHEAIKGSGSGYYWATPAAERLWDVLGRSRRD